MPDIVTRKVRVGNRVVEVKLRPIPLEELKARNAAKRQAQIEAEAAERVEPETVDVAEVKREVRRREKAENAEGT